MSLRMRDLQQILDKFTNGNKGTAISDCFIYMENDRGGLNEIGRIELQQSQLIGKQNSSSAWRVVLKKRPKKDISSINNLQARMIESNMDNARPGANRETGRHFG